MPICDTCGNEYDKTFDVVTIADDTYTFDSFECAIHMLAPRCAHCNVRILGHGVEAEGVIYCSAHCAEKKGISAIKDRV